MRMQELNQSKLWYVNRIDDVDVMDENGYFTGELETVFSEPIPIDLHLYPANGKVLEDTFGINAQLDFITGTSIKLEPDTLLFRTRPLTDYEDSYDFKIDKILSSLNIYQYGLKGRR